MYFKRQQTSKRWPIPRKGSVYVVRPNHDKENSLPVLVILRDILKKAGDRKEVKRALYAGDILLNGEKCHDEKNSLVLFDTLTIVPSKEVFRLTLSESGKYSLENASEKESLSKIAKVINKRILNGKKVQINLSDGRNYLSEIKCNTNDSLVIDLKNKKVIECLPLKEGAKALVFKGKHTGKKGLIKEINLKEKMAKISYNSEDIKVLIKQLIVIK